MEPFILEVFELSPTDAADFEETPFKKFISHRKERDEILNCAVGPVVFYSNGNEEWWLNKQRHRVDGPAIIDADGSQSWLVNGKNHRVDGPAYIGADGSTGWYLNGIMHREDGPALKMAGGHEEWFFHGLYHRVDGPAQTWGNHQTWWLFGDKVSEWVTVSFHKVLLQQFEEKDIPLVPYDVLLALYQNSR